MSASGSLANYLDNLALVFNISVNDIVKISGVEGSIGNFNYVVYFGDTINIDINKLNSDLFGFTLHTGVREISASISTPDKIFAIPRSVVNGIAVSFN